MLTLVECLEERLQPLVRHPAANQPLPDDDAGMVGVRHFFPDELGRVVFRFRKVVTVLAALLENDLNRWRRLFEEPEALDMGRIGRELVDLGRNLVGWFAAG